MVKVLRSVAPLFCLFLISCGAQESLDDASAQISVFHQDLNKGDYDAIWGETAKEFRDVTRKEDFQKLLKAVREKLGDVESSKQIGWKVNSTTQGTFTIVGMDTDFAEGKGQETFTYIRNDDLLELAGYNINSTDMMVK